MDRESHALDVPNEVYIEIFELKYQNILFTYISEEFNRLNHFRHLKEGCIKHLMIYNSGSC